MKEISNFDKNTVKLKIERGFFYDKVYAIKADSIELKRYLPHDGYFLWHIKATYARNLKPSNYYILAKNKHEAKNRFKRIFVGLNYISNIVLVEESEKRKILGNPKHYIII